MSADRLRMAHASVRPPRVTEKVEQSHGVQLLRSLGGVVYVTGTRRRSTDYQGTMMTPGLPDVFAFLPRRGETSRRILLVWECKAADGRLRPEQQEFRTLCANADINHVVGPLDALIAWLIAHELLSPQSVPHYRQPQG